MFFERNFKMANKYDIAAYIWPSYTGDEPRTRIFWPEGYGEWQTVKSATAKFPGHVWPRKPLWGYVNEADPYVMEMEIEAAAAHGVNVFIYDWYWYDNRPFLEQCLDNGYLKARNNDKVKFYVMWANHDASSLWDKRTSERYPTDILWDGKVNFTQFKTIVDRIINMYFSHPSYYKINGKPVFMLYLLENFVQGLGSIDEAKKALEYFREQTVKAGFPGLHLQLVIRNNTFSKFWGDEKFEGTFCDAANYLEFDSYTNYQFGSCTDVKHPYPEVLDAIKEKWKEFEDSYKNPYYPHVSLGWDNNPRFKELMPTITTDTTPENIKKGYEAVKEYIDTHKNLEAPLITLNSWNEWTEGSYLEPDDINGYEYLEKLKEVFLGK